MMRRCSLPLLLVFWIALGASSHSAAACPSETKTAADAPLIAEPEGVEPAATARGEAGATTLQQEVRAPTVRSASRQEPRARWHRYLPGMFK